MFNVEGLMVLTGDEPFSTSKGKEIATIIAEEGNGEEFIINNIQCKIKRMSHMGTWCGYAGVDRNHPWYGKGYDELVTIKDVDESLNNRNPDNINIFSVIMDVMEGNFDNDTCSISTAVNVHGGITYSGTMNDDDDLWYFGFDCAHCYDYVPSYSHILGDLENTTYRTKEFVINECHRLVDQLLTIPM